MVRSLSARTVLRRFVGTVAAAAIVVAGVVGQEAAAARIGEMANRGRSERARGEIDASIATFESAREVADAAGDRRSSVVLDSEIVKSLSQAGRYEAAVDILGRIEDRLDDFEDDPLFAAAVLVHVRSDRSLTLQRLGRLHEALESARGAVEAARSTEISAARGSAYAATGNSFLWLGRPAEARRWLERAVEEFDELPRGDARRTELRMRLAQCVGELGDAESALEIADRVVDEFEALEAPSAAVGCEIYDVRGQLQYYRDWNAAERDLRRSLELLRASEPDDGSVRLQQAALNLAHAIRNAGRPEESAALERGALSVLRDRQLEAHPTAVRAAQFLAASLRDLWARDGDRARLAEARGLLEEAARTARATDDPNAAEVFGLLGEVLLDAFDEPSEAETWLRAAVERIEHEAPAALALDEESRAGLLQRRRLRKRHDPYEGLLRCLLRLDRPEEALDVLERSRARSLADLLERGRTDSMRVALQRAEEIGDEETAERLRRLPDELDDAVVALAKAQPDARDRLRRLQDERASLTRDATAVGGVATVDAIRSQLGRGEVMLAYFLGRAGSYACLVEPQPGRVDWFPLVDEAGRPLTSDDIESRSRAWIDFIGRGLGDPARGFPRAGSPSAGPESPTLASHRLFRSLVPRALWDRLRERTIAHLLPHGPLNHLPFESLVVEPPRGIAESSYWLDVGPAVAYQESGSAFAWSQRRRSEQRGIAGEGEALVVSDPAYGSAGARPETSGVGPVVVRVDRDGPAARAGVWAGDRIVSLAGARIESIEDYERVLGGMQDVSEAPCILVRSGSERSFLLPQEEPGWEVAAALPSDPEPRPDRASSASLEQLPGTAREARAVEEALRGRIPVRHLTGTEATETLLTAWSARARIAHVAAHQVPDPTDVGSSRLALVEPPFPTAEDDGSLDLDDLLLHWRGRLDGCELVVLSSCASRTGRLMRDEGFFGLPLGLRFAGCPSIVSSLWPVDDAATAELMTAFYESITVSGGHDGLAALQRAKRSLRRERPDPYFWAAFVWTGAAR